MPSSIPTTNTRLSAIGGKVTNPTADPIIPSIGPNLSLKTESEDALEYSSFTTLNEAPYGMQEFHNYEGLLEMPSFSYSVRSGSSGDTGQLAVTTQSGIAPGIAIGVWFEARKFSNSTSTFLYMGKLTSSAGSGSYVTVNGTTTTWPTASSTSIFVGSIALEIDSIKIATSFSAVNSSGFLDPTNDSPSTDSTYSPTTFGSVSKPGEYGGGMYVQAFTAECYNTERYNGDATYTITLRKSGYQDTTLNNFVFDLDSRAISTACF